MLETVERIDPNTNRILGLPQDPSDDWSFVDGPRGSPTTILGYIQLDAGHVFRSGISGELIDLGGIDRSVVQCIPRVDPVNVRVGAWVRLCEDVV